jgi:nitrogen-specific signal transduction histidine kinase
VITGASQLLLEQLPIGSEQRADVVDIDHAATRAAYLTRQLLAFSRRQVLQMQVVSLNTVVRDIETILRRVIGEDVELQTRLAADLGSVRADPSQAEVILLAEDETGVRVHSARVLRRAATRFSTHRMGAPPSPSRSSGRDQSISSSPT